MRRAGWRKVREAPQDVPRARGEDAAGHTAPAGLAIVAVLVSGPVALIGFVAALLLGKGPLAALGIAFMAQVILVAGVIALGRLVPVHRQRSRRAGCDVSDTEAGQTETERGTR
jgi:Zn-dependent membrane protease YugP